MLPGTTLRHRRKYRKLLWFTRRNDSPTVMLYAQCAAVLSRTAAVEPDAVLTFISNPKRKCSRLYFEIHIQVVGFSQSHEICSLVALCDASSFEQLIECAEQKTIYIYMPVEHIHTHIRFG